MATSTGIGDEVLDDSGFPRISVSRALETETESFAEESVDPGYGRLLACFGMDHLGSSSSSCAKLGKDNFGNWKIEIKDVLEANGILDVTDGTTKKPDGGSRPEEKKELADWIAGDAKARHIIRRTLDEVTLNHVRECKTSKEILDKITTHREPQTTDALMTALLDFMGLKWTASDDVTGFMSRLSVIQGQVTSSQSGANQLKLDDKLLIAKTLASLPGSFTPFIQSWYLTAKSDAKLEDFTKHLRKAEILIEEKTEPTAGDVYQAGFRKQDTVRKDQRRDSRKKKIPDLKKRTEFKGNCFGCGKPGHMKMNCPDRKQSGSTADAGSNGSTSGPGSSKKDGGVMNASCAFKVISDAGCILADSGASHHLTGNKSWFCSMRRLEAPHVFNAAGSCIQSTHVGSIRVDVSIDGKNWTQKTWEDVHYCEQMGQTTLLSTGVMAKKGFAFMHDDQIMSIYSKSSREPFIGGYVLPNTSNCIPYIRIRDPGMSCFKAESLDLWHRRLGHVSDNCIKLMESKGLVDGLSLDSSTRDFCEGCRLGKMTIGSHPQKLERRSCHPGERIHSDVCHVPLESITGFKYFLTFKDESSGYRIVYFLKSKEQVPPTIKSFLESVERVTGRKVISFRSDCGTEYCNQEVEGYLKSSGIQHETSAPYVKQGNGMAERENRTLQDTARAMLFNVDLSKTQRESLWSEAVGTAAYLRNRVPNRDDRDATPHEKWTGRKPDVSHLKVFGSPAYVRIPDAMRKKMDPKSWKGIFVGYDSLTEKIFRVFDPVRGKVFRVADVIIEDGGDKPFVLFPFPVNSHDHDAVDHGSTPVAETDDTLIGTSDPTLVGSPMEQDSVPVADDEELSSSEEEKSESDEDDDDSFHSLETLAPEPTPEKRPVGRPKKGDEKPKEDPGPHRMSMRTRQPVDYKKEKISMMTVALDPVSVTDALSRVDGDRWKEAMDSEMKSLIDNETWILVDRPKDQDTVSCRWIFKSKLKPDGSIGRYKGRLVARGFQQRHGIDYQETFASVVRYESIRVVLSLAAHHDMDMMQFDIKTAFLNGPLHEKVFMEQPDRYSDGSDRVCLLKKSLYGLKQAPRNWNQTFDEFVKSEGFKSSIADPGLYYRKVDKELMLLTLYVDDGLICSTSRMLLDGFIQKLTSRFETTVNDPAVYVGMQITRDREEKTIRICQSRYIRQVLQRFGQDGRSVSTPMQPGIKILDSGSEKEYDASFPYLEAVGCLMYLSSVSRPDITFAVVKMASFSRNPSMVHWNCVKRILKYLSGTQDASLTFGGEEPLVFRAVTDSDWGGDHREMKSTSGFMMLLNGSPVSWTSRLQKKTALSSLEAEYVSLAEGLKEILYFRKLLKPLGVDVSNPTSVDVDNKSVVALSFNPEFHNRSKFVTIKYFRIRQENGSRIQVNWIPTTENPADILTKALDPLKLKKMLHLIRFNLNEERR